MTDDIRIDAALVCALIAAQFPDWAGLAVRAVVPGGWDNRTFRLGDDMLVRLPSAARYAAQVEKEQRWLPVLARGLPVAVPEPLAMGQASEMFPWAWSVYGWIAGEPATGALGVEVAAGLAAFLQALWR
ncbi:MAG: phosphotransferase, partial [Paracoccaceae bacterium]